MRERAAIIATLALLLPFAPRAAAQGTTLERIAAQTPAPLATPVAAAPPLSATPGATPDPDARVWEARSAGIKQSVVSAIAASPADPRQLVAGTSRGFVYQSSDGGRTWTQTLRIARERGDDATAAATGGDTGNDTTDEQDAELEDLRQQTIDDLVEELTPLVGADEAERTAEDEADQVVEERQAEMQEENRATQDAGAADDSAGPPARSAAIRYVAWDPTFPGLVYVATRNGVWRSPDGGSSWVQLPVGTGDEDRDAIVVAPSCGNPDRILVGTGSGLLVTADGGLSWSRATGEVANLEVRAIAIDPDHRNLVAVGTPDGAFLSADGGDTFRRIYASSGDAGDVRALAFGPGEGADLYEGTANGVWLITPDGATPLGVSDFRAPSIRAIVAPAGDASRVYVATGRGVYESRDAGKTFQEVYRGLDSNDALALAEDFSSVDGLFAATTLGVYRLVPESLAAAMAAPRISGPNSAELVRAAAHYARLDGPQLQKIRRDANLSPWLPVVRGEYRWNWADDRTAQFVDVYDLQGTLIAIDPAGDTAAWNHNTQVTLTFTWSFDELVGGSRKQRLLQQVSQVTRERNRLLAKVARLARERKDTAARLAAGVADDAERTSLALRLQELEAYLDAATGGAISHRSTGGTTR
ncbi:MAG TPA: hypothetical protein VMV18_11575 [bacterium]|nr:hypothetical protein [bacterium]